MRLDYTTRTTPTGQMLNITLDPWSNGLSVKNTGNSICIFNDDPLQPGESKTIGGNKGELLRGRYAVKFQTPATVPVGYVQFDQAVVTEKYYLDNEINQKYFNQKLH